MDYGMTAGTGPYSTTCSSGFVRTFLRSRPGDPSTHRDVHRRHRHRQRASRSRSTISTSARTPTVTASCSSSLFRGQVNAVGNPTDVTDFEVLDQAIGPSPSKRAIPDSLVGYTPRNAPARTPPRPTACTSRVATSAGTASSPRTDRRWLPSRQASNRSFGGNVNVTAPKHFHGLLAEINHNGIFEYMEQELDRPHQGRQRRPQSHGGGSRTAPN